VQNALPISLRISTALAHRAHLHHPVKKLCDAMYVGLGMLRGSQGFCVLQGLQGLRFSATHVLQMLHVCCMLRACCGPCNTRDMSTLTSWIIDVAYTNMPCFGAQHRCFARELGPQHAQHNTETSQFCWRCVRYALPSFATATTRLHEG
jgi:hypothetical protein